MKRIPPQYKAEHAFREIAPGLIRLDQRIAVSGVISGVEVSGPCWFFGHMKIRKGLYRAGSTEQDPPSREFGLFLPPFSIVRIQLTNAAIISESFFSRRPIDSGGYDSLLMFSLRGTNSDVRSAADISKLVKSSHRLVPVQECRPIPISVRIKNAIDREYATNRLLADIAEELKLPASLKSRYFKRDFGITPI